MATTDIDMDTDRAKNLSWILGDTIDKLIETRKLLTTQCEGMTSYWQCGSSDEFQDLHRTQMMIFWDKIQTLKGLQNQLNATIEVAEQVDRDLSGG